VVLIIQKIIYPNLDFFKNESDKNESSFYISGWLPTGTSYGFFIFIFFEILAIRKPKGHSYFFTNLKRKLARIF